MATIATPGILIETSASILNHDTENSPSTRKRKRDHDEELHVLQPFTIKPHLSSKFDEPLSLIPLFSIPRSNLALSFLDAGDVPLSTGRGRLFSAKVAVLNEALEAAGGQLVLIARLISNGRLFAVERVKTGIYALCRLGNWVIEGNLRPLQWRSAASPTQSSSISPREIPTGREPLPWWHSVRLETEDVHPEASFDRRRPKTKGLLQIRASEASENVRDATSFDVSGEETSHVEDMHNVPEAQEQVVEPVHTSFSKQTPQDVFEKVRMQYLETLYISKSSVAYFAKGPLARARVAFTSEVPTEGQTRDFADCLRGGILPLKKLDQKYKDALPNSVKQFTSGVHEGQGGDLPPSKKRKSKKKRLGKDGMYPDEDEFVAQWWNGRSICNPTEYIGASHDPECKRLLAELRLRETQLQILLILEVIGLEQLIQPTGGTELEGGETIANASASTKPKLKSPEDSRSLLDLLLDRLCIWQSLSIEQGVSPEKTVAPQTERKLGKTSDVLRDFCAEVIVPFYASRLPECCKTISRKFGAVATVSPARPPLTKAASTSQVLPGTSMRRERREQPRRPLQRVLTDEKAASHLRPSSLMRSNTTPSNRLIKREESETSQVLQAGIRGGIQKAKRIDNREVDLDAIAKQHEAKLKKMNVLKEQKKELDDAISALRKPNRTLVSKDFVDTVVQRTTTNSRKARKPVRNPAGIGVQVTATPKVNRKRDVHIGSRSRRLHAHTARTLTHSPDAQPPEFPSSETHISSSVIRPGPIQIGQTIARESVTAIPHLYTVQETPSRGPSRQSNPLGLKQKAQPLQDNENELPPALPPIPRLPKASNGSFKIPDHPLQTPRAMRHMPLSATITPHHRRVIENESTPSQHSRRLRQTSLKTLITPGTTVAPDDGEDELAFVPASSPPMPSRPNSEKNDSVGEKSIFEALGWDNYNDDLDELA